MGIADFKELDAFHFSVILCPAFPFFDDRLDYVAQKKPFRKSRPIVRPWSGQGVVTGRRYGGQAPPPSLAPFNETDETNETLFSRGGERQRSKGKDQRLAEES